MTTKDLRSNFTGPLRVVFHGSNISLTAALSWVENYGDPDSEVVVIPAGADSDGASSPPLSWPIMGHPYRYPRAAALHDYGYRTPDARTQYALGQSRKWWDQQYRQALIVEGCPRWRAHTQYAALRAFGAGAFQ